MSLGAQGTAVNQAWRVSEGSQEKGCLGETQGVKEEESIIGRGAAVQRPGAGKYRSLGEAESPRISVQDSRNW